MAVGASGHLGVAVLSPVMRVHALEQEPAQSLLHKGVGLTVSVPKVT